MHRHVHAKVVSRRVRACEEHLYQDVSSDQNTITKIRLLVKKPDWFGLVHLTPVLTCWFLLWYSRKSAPGLNEPNQTSWADVWSRVSIHACHSQIKSTVRKSITSQEIPSLAAKSAAFCNTSICAPQASKVISLPVCTTSALPIGS